jgi:protein TonB
MTKGTDKLSPYLVASAAVHVGLVALVLLGPKLFASSPRDAWGTTTYKGIRVGVVSDLPGIPLPAPPVVDPGAKPTETKTLHAPEAAPKNATKVPDKPAEVKIPERGAKKPKQTDASASRGTKTATPPPPAPDTNAIPGEGRPVDLPYGKPGASGQASFSGDGTFGSKYGWYVTAMTKALQDQWFAASQMLPAGATRRVYVTFTIDRSGKTSDLAIDESSGSTPMDNSAKRAVLTAKIPALPPDYRGSTVDVRFYFENKN